MNDGSDLAIIVPLWKRSDNVERLAASIEATVPAARVVFVVSQGDVPLARMALPGDIVTIPGPGGQRGDYARKINAGYAATDEPVLFTGADDIVFHDRWYDAARTLLDVPTIVDIPLSHGATLTGPARIPRVGVVGTNDLANPRTQSGEHSTHSLVARWYADMGCSADQGAMIYHEGYYHEYCDDEMIQTAIARGAYAHAFGAHVEHWHPIVGPRAPEVPDDVVYRRGRAFTSESRRLYQRRRWLWGGGDSQRRMFVGRDN